MLLVPALLIVATLLNAVRANTARSDAARSPQMPFSEPMDQHASSLYEAQTRSGSGPIDLALPGSKIVRKELCYRSVYAQPQRFERVFGQQVPMQDAQGIDFLLRDAFVHLANGTEAYVLEHCYPQNEPEAPQDLGFCPVRAEAEDSTTRWKRGISLYVDSGKRDWEVVFDQASFLHGFIPPVDRMPIEVLSVGYELEGEEEVGSDIAQTIFEDGEEEDLDREPFNPFADADFDFFAAFEQGYPGHDSCDEHGCWERKIVTGP